MGEGETDKEGGNAEGEQERKGKDRNGKEKTIT